MDMNFFYQEDFALNTRWNVTIQKYKKFKILFIDNVYKHPLKVYDFLKKAPIMSHKPTKKGSLNGKDFLDGQYILHPQCYLDKGRKKLASKICEFFKLPPPKSNLDTRFNQFQLIKDYPGLDYYYNVHVDDCSLNVLTYLNPDENMTSGTSIYEQTGLMENGDFDFEDEHSNAWIHKRYFNEQLCLLSNFNTAVVFPGFLPHSQKLIDNRFKSKSRFTEVTFL
jgi:hypothetical protein